MSATQARPLRDAASSFRPSKKTLLRMERLAGILVLLATGGLFAGFIVQSPQFKVQRVLFEGVHALTEERVLETAGITVDDSIVFFDGTSVERRVETLPYVKRCEAKRVFPNSVLLRIIERKPIATVAVNNRLFEVDREYVALREVSPFAPHEGPLITNLPDLFALEPGQQMAIPALEQALTLWETFSSSPLADELTLSEISAEAPNRLRMFFDELPYELRWGRSGFEEQLRRLEMLWQELKGQLPCQQYLDLRFDADLVCK